MEGEQYASYFPARGDSSTAYLQISIYKGKSSWAFYLTAITAFPLSLAKEQDAG